MSDVAIRVQNLSKRYRIGSRARYKALRDSLTDAMYAPFRGLRSLARRAAGAAPGPSGSGNDDRFIWALNDVCLEVKQGEAVGIIGRNGAGKTTLLKVLSRVTEPTRGVAEVHGRVGSLLEVGTGFHPELTGRENLYLNGAILGMRRAEINRKFDEIVAFAEVEKFLDTPMKRYSSGMQTRLAFAVAAHLEPEILLVDEVLAVGDAAFQKKCVGKMGEVARGGRTVVFVSHQMNSIRRLCERCVWLDGGQIRSMGPTAGVVAEYETSFTADQGHEARDEAEAAGAHARFLRWEIVEPKGERPNFLTTLGPVTFRVVVRVNRPIRNGRHGIALRDSQNQIMWGSAAYGLRLEPGLHEFVYSLPTLPLRPGVYSALVSLFSDERLVDVWDCVPDMIVATEPVTHPRDEWAGILNVPCDFRVRCLE